jgi:hypothetical protein
MARRRPPPTRCVPYTRVGLGTWLAATPAQRNAMQHFWIDIDDLSQPEPERRCGEFEEYAGEASDRHVDHRGFN